MNENISVKWGAIGGLITVAFGVLSYLLNLTESKSMQYMGVLILLAVVIFALFEYRDKENGGFARLGELLKVGVLTILIIAVVSAIWNYVFVTFLDTDFIRRTLLQTEIQMENEGLPEEQIKQAMKMTKMLMTPFYMAIISFFSTAILGSIVSLVGALILKKERPEAVLDDNSLDGTI